MNIVQDNPPSCRTKEGGRTRKYCARGRNPGQPWLLREQGHAFAVVLRPHPHILELGGGWADSSKLCRARGGITLLRFHVGRADGIRARIACRLRDHVTLRVEDDRDHCELDFARYTLAVC